MNLFKFITREIPKRCEVSPIYGYVANMIYEAEEKGDPQFQHDMFNNVRERAALALPFNPGNQKEYEKCLDVVEMSLLNHRIKKHGEIKYQDRLDELKSKRKYSKTEMSVGTAEWWNG